MQIIDFIAEGRPRTRGVHYHDNDVWLPGTTVRRVGIGSPHAETWTDPTLIYNFNHYHVTSLTGTWWMEEAVGGAPGRTFATWQGEGRDLNGKQVLI